VYGFRSKLGDKLAPYADDATKEALGKLLEETEDWLYEDGEDETKAGAYTRPRFSST